MIQESSIIGGQEYRCITESILSLVKYNLRTNAIQIKIDQNSQKPISDKTLNDIFKKYCMRERNRLDEDGITIDSAFRSDPDLFSVQSNERLRNNYIKFNAWQRAKGRWMEYLYFLSLLTNYDLSKYHNRSILLNSTEPVEVLEANEKKYIWLQKEIESTSSGFKARPDIIITNSRERIDSSSILNIIEIKCRKKLSAIDIRQEFGKAFDLGISSYLIVSYHSVNNSLIVKAKKMGIDVDVFELNTESRIDFINNTRDLSTVVREKLKKSISENSFLLNLEKTVNQTKEKQLL